jgi:predicted GNAT family N-acyltransferase
VRWPQDPIEIQSQTMASLSDPEIIPSPCCHTLSVTLEDGSSVKYTTRGLRDDEISSWADFCASVFRDKANPPPASYFERHYRNDPHAEADLVRVVWWNDEMVSSCRIFRKELSLGDGETVIVGGGIGEVCTACAHRRRGLSKFLLHDAINIMKDRQMQVSLLHAAPEFFPVYERGGGYESTRSEWSIATIRVDQLFGEAQQQHDASSSISFTTRLADFPKDTSRLQFLHREFSEKRFAGCIVRSEQYWNHYLSKELEGTLHVLEDDSNTIVAWISLRQRGDRYQIRDFGCDLTFCEIEKVVPPLLSASLRDFELSSPSSTVDLILPTVVLNLLGSEKRKFIQAIANENDLGWMYVTLQKMEST